MTFAQRRNYLTTHLSERIPVVNPLNAELNPICCLLALLGAHHFLHVSRIRVKRSISVRIGIRQAASLTDAPDSYQLLKAGDITASRLSPYLEAVIGHDQRAFPSSRSTLQILVGEMEIPCGKRLYR